MRRAASIASLALVLAAAATAGPDSLAPTTNTTVVPDGPGTVRVKLRATDRGGSGVRDISA